MVIIFKQRTAPYLSWAYAACEGLALGGISMIFEYMYPGIVMGAIGMTLGIFLVMLFFYRTGIIKASRNLYLGLMAAMFGILLYYVFAIVMGSLFATTVPLLYDTGWMGILFSVIVVVVAALNLVLDFDFIEYGVDCGAPKYMEWYAAFGLLVTLVWLYLEVLRLLAKLRGSSSD